MQSADGRVADLAALRAASDTYGTQLFVDATQACGWLPLEAAAFDYCAADAYKWLLAPKGTAFMTVKPERLEALLPHGAGWYAGEDVWNSAYGPPLRLAASARRLDVSPAWFSMVGTHPALELVETAGVDAINDTVALRRKASVEPSEVEAVFIGIASRRSRTARLFPCSAALSIEVEAAGRGDRSMQQCPRSDGR